METNNTPERIALDITNWEAATVAELAHFLSFRPAHLGSPLVKSWEPGTDPATIPESVLLSELGRRRAAKRKVFSGGKQGRQKVFRPCPKCQAVFSAAEMRRHKCGGIDVTSTVE